MGDPAQRHGGPDAGWYVLSDHGWQRISDGEVGGHGDAAHFMSDPNGRPASMLQPVTIALDDDESELTRVPMRPVTEAEEAENVW